MLFSRKALHHFDVFVMATNELPSQHTHAHYRLHNAQHFRHFHDVLNSTFQKNCLHQFQDGISFVIFFLSKHSEMAIF